MFCSDRTGADHVLFLQDRRGSCSVLTGQALIMFCSEISTHVSQNRDSSQTVDIPFGLFAVSILNF
jgi:hypothetical protein